MSETLTIMDKIEIMALAVRCDAINFETTFKAMVDFIVNYEPVALPEQGLIGKKSD